MRRLLVVNPNTTASITELLRRHATAAADGRVAVDAIGARFGAAYIVDEPTAAVGAQAALDAYAAHVATHGAPDAVLLGCFGDPGLDALREAAGPVPVVGLAEASMAHCARLGSFAIVTGGAKWAPMLERLARVLRLDPALAGVHTLARGGGELAADPDGAPVALADACAEAAARWPGIRAVLLGGAGLAGLSEPVGTLLAARWSSSSPPPAVLDSVGLAMAEAVAVADS